MRDASVYHDGVESRRKAWDVLSGVSVEMKPASIRVEADAHHQVVLTIIDNTGAALIVAFTGAARLLRSDGTGAKIQP